jgi:hypothetical protein
MNEEKYTEINPDVKFDWNRLLIMMLFELTVKLTLDTLTPLSEAVITPWLAKFVAVIDDG